MEKKTSKILSIFWLVSGTAWTIAAIRHILVKDDVVGVVIYAVAAVVSLVLALAHYRNLAGGIQNK